MNTSKKIFFKVLISYFSVLAVPVIAGLVVYRSSLTSVTRLFRDDTRAMLHQIVDSADLRFQELEHIPYYLKSNSDFSSFLRLEEIPEGSPETYQVYQAYSNMPKFSLVNSSVEDIQVIALNNYFVVGQTGALRLSKQTYASLFDFADMDYEAFSSYLEDHYFLNNFLLLHDSHGNNRPILLSSFNYDGSAIPLAVVAISLKESYLEGILEDLLSSEGGVAFILGENDEMIAHVSGKDDTLDLTNAVSYIKEEPSEDSDYGNYMVTVLESGYNQWKYCIFSPKEAILSRMSATASRLLVLIAISLLFSIVFTYFLVRRKADSLKQVIRYLNGESRLSTHRDEFSYIADSATRLVSSNQKLRQTLAAQKPLLDAAALHNLLSGVTYKPEELRYLFQYLDIRADHQFFAVMLVSIHPPVREHPEYESYPVLPSALVQEQINRNISLSTYSLDIDNSHKALIFIGTELTEEVFCEKLLAFTECIVQDSFTEGKLSLTCYLSDTYRMVDDISTAYRQATVISRQATRREGAFLYTAGDIPAIQRFYYYPIQTERDLMRNIRHGTRQELINFLENLRKANFVDRSLSASTTTQFLFAVSNSILRELNSLPPEQIPRDLMGNLEKVREFDELSEIILALNQHFVQVNTQVNSEKAEKQAQEILQFINDHYTDQDFSINQICEHFHMSESSAYQIFRETVGTPLTGLVEHMRIEKACQMLNEKKYRIKDIAEAVGYTNDNSFRRAFKRVMGITPGEYTP